MSDLGIDLRLEQMLDELPPGAVRDRLAGFALDLAEPADRPSAAEIGAALRPFGWFLDRASDGGIALTSAGYLRPDDVVELAELLPQLQRLPGAKNRESHLPPLQAFREELVRVGLLRKRDGALLLTRAGTSVRADPEALWAHLAGRLVPAPAGSFEESAAILGLLVASTGPTGRELKDGMRAAATALGDLGWTVDEHPPQHDDVSHARHNPFVVLANVGERGEGWDDLSPEARALAREALLA